MTLKVGVFPHLEFTFSHGCYFLATSVSHIILAIGDTTASGINSASHFTGLVVFCQLSFLCQALLWV
jgi:hypothetical protein